MSSRKYDIHDIVENEDELVNVVLPKKEYVRLRKILEREAALNWVGKWLMTGFFAFIGGLITFMLFIDKIKLHVASMFKGG